jgi:hypothetical protein
MVESAIYIARVMGPFLIILGIWFLFCQDFLTKLRISGEKAQGILYLGGVLNLLIGLLIIVAYNVWEMNIFLVVTLLGWFAVLRGIYMLFMPANFLGWKKPGGFIFKIYGMLPMVWGIFLLFAGYFS